MKLIEPEILHTCVRLKIELLKLRIIKTILILNLKKDITSSFFFSNIIFPLGNICCCEILTKRNDIIRNIYFKISIRKKIIK